MGRVAKTRFQFIQPPQALPYELLPATAVARWVFAAAIRGRPGLLRHFLAQGRRVRQVQKEVAAARKELEAISPAA